MKHADPNSLVITLTADQMERLDEVVQSGEYASKLDVVMDALQLWERHHTEEADRVTAWHRHEHEEGLASGLAEDLSPEERLVQIKAEFALRG
jgi:Arc/MetJ-type ribon-helix-helix transcriptional regulator